MGSSLVVIARRVKPFAETPGFVSPFTLSSKGVNASPSAVHAAVKELDFFAQFGEETLRVLRNYFFLCNFEASDKRPIVAVGSPATFVGIIVTGALTVTDEASSPLFSLSKDDTLGETLVTINRDGEWETQVHLPSRSPSTPEYLELYSAHQPSPLCPAAGSRILPFLLGQLHSILCSREISLTSVPVCTRSARSLSGSPELC